MTTLNTYLKKIASRKMWVFSCFITPQMLKGETSMILQSIFITSSTLFFIIVILSPLLVLFYIMVVDRNQKQHSVLRNYPLLGKVRYFLEIVGPELRQYLFDHDNTGKPFSRNDFLSVVFSGKYLKNVISFGSKRDFEAPGYYISNHIFSKQTKELKVDQSEQIETSMYHIDKESLFARKEHAKKKKVNPWLLPKDDAIVIGPDCKHPFIVRGQIGMSGMSHGALGENAISALSLGLGMARGTWMNTGEGGLSPYHLKGNCDIIMQIGPGLFGVRNKVGDFSWEEIKKKGELPQVKAFELKLGQGAKTRGGHVEGKKVSPEIAVIRGVEPYKTIDSPNRFNEFNDVPSMVKFIEQIRGVVNKPVGIKVVIGSSDSLEELANYMKITGKGPDFISLDGGEGGTGATYQELADSVGLPIKSAIMIADRTLKQYGVRDRVKIIASGKLFSPDRIAIALAMGADLVCIARGFMITVGCILAQKCHTNECPVGVATTDPNFQKALVIEEKKFRVVNYVLALREGLFTLAASSGIDSPTKFKSKHVMYKDERGIVYSLNEVYKNIIQEE